MRSTAPSSSSHNDHGLFFSMLKALMEEDCITFSERGQCVIALGKFLQVHESCTASTEFSGNVCARLREIIDTGKRTHTLKNAVMEKVWVTFHKFRFSESLLETWPSFLRAVKAPLPLQVEAQLTLQLLVDRLFKRLITITAETDCKYNVQRLKTFT